MIELSEFLQRFWLGFAVAIIIFSVVAITVTIIMVLAEVFADWRDRP